MVAKYAKRGSSHEYIAARLGGPLDPLPSWFPVLVRAGKLRVDAVSGDIEVRVITGRWWVVNTGDWVVLQREGANVYHIEHEDFVQLFEEAT